MSHESILDSVKNSLGLTAEYDVFDPVIIMHINSVFSNLTQIGVGPAQGFMIEDAQATWDAFLEPDHVKNMIKGFVYAKVRLAFDPPPTSFHIAAIEKQAAEYEWRLYAYKDTPVTDTTPIVIGGPVPDAFDTHMIIDGGGAS